MTPLDAADRRTAAALHALAVLILGGVAVAAAAVLRRGLVGWSEGFYAACAAWGTCLSRDECSHRGGRGTKRRAVVASNAAAPAAAAAAAAPLPVNTFQAKQQQRRPPPPDLVQLASRHRFKFVPAPTPPGFWDMGFNDSLDSRVEKRAEAERARANAERRRKREEESAAEGEKGGKRQKGGDSGKREPGT